MQFLLCDVFGLQFACVLAVCLLWQCQFTFSKDRTQESAAYSLKVENFEINGHFQFVVVIEFEVRMQEEDLFFITSFEYGTIYTSSSCAFHFTFNVTGGTLAFFYPCAEHDLFIHINFFQRTINIDRVIV